MVLKLFVSFVFSVHCERLQSLSNNKCFMDPDEVKYILIQYMHFLVVRN